MKQNIVYICIYGVILFLIPLVLHFYLAILFLLRSILFCVVSLCRAGQTAASMLHCSKVLVVVTLHVTEEALLKCLIEYVRVWGGGGGGVYVHVHWRNHDSQLTAVLGNALGQRVQPPVAATHHTV